MEYVQILIAFYRCYDALVFELENVCTFVAFSYVKPTYWCHTVKECENFNLFCLTKSVDRLVENVAAGRINLLQ